MHEPLTAEDLATFARLREEAKAPPDTEHESECACPACDAQVEKADAAAEALFELRRLDAVGRLLAEVRRLREALAVSERDANALMDRLAEPAPSDKAAAERSVRVDKERGGKAVSLQSTPDNFIVLARGLGDYDADIIAGSMQNILEGILTDHVTQVRAELAADRAAVRALVDMLPACRACSRTGVRRPSTVGLSGHVASDLAGNEDGACDEHADRHNDPGFARDEDLPWAAPLRALLARMATWGEAAPAKVTREPEASPRWAAALQHEAEAFARYKAPDAHRDAIVLGRAAKLVRDEREARLILEALGWDTDAAVERVLRGSVDDQPAARASEEQPTAAPADADRSAHELDVARIRKALETSDDPEDIEDAIDWPAFWARRARLGRAAEAIEEPVRATVEWMGQERDVAPQCCGEWLSGSGGHRMYSGCSKLATWRDAVSDGSVHFCDNHVGQLDPEDREPLGGVGSHPTRREPPIPSTAPAHPPDEGDDPHYRMVDVTHDPFGEEDESVAPDDDSRRDPAAIVATWPEWKRAAAAKLFHPEPDDEERGVCDAEAAERAGR